MNGAEQINEDSVDQPIVLDDKSHHSNISQISQKRARIHKSDSFRLNFNNTLNVHKKKIMIVDINHFNNNAIKIILEHICGLDVDKWCVEAVSGKDALNKIIQDVKDNNYESTSFNLIFLDENMPLMKGHETCLKIRQFLLQNNLPQPIISAITGESDPNKINNCFKNGMN